MNLTELEEYLRSFAQYKLVVQVTPYKEGHCLTAIDEDIFDYETESGEMETMNASVRVGVLFTDKDGVVTAIEHPYGLFTRVNKAEVLRLVSLIGEKVEVPA